MAFDNQEAATKFADLLQHQNARSFSNPQPVGMALAELQTFCSELGVLVQFVPSGMDLIPPRQNSDRFGHRDPTLREKQKHLEYLFAMEETEIVEQEGLLLEAVGVGSWD